MYWHTIPWTQTHTHTYAYYTYVHIYTHAFAESGGDLFLYVAGTPTNSFLIGNLLPRFSPTHQHFIVEGRTDPIQVRQFVCTHISCVSMHIHTLST
jgi:hypothetical protein